MLRFYEPKSLVFAVLFDFMESQVLSHKRLIRDEYLLICLRFYPGGEILFSEKGEKIFRYLPYSAFQYLFFSLPFRNLKSA